MAIYQSNIIETPSGKYVWVGSVDYRLAYIKKDGEEITQGFINNAVHLGHDWGQQVKRRIFETREDAEAAAAKLDEED